MSDIQITKEELEDIEWRIKRFEYGVNRGSSLIEKLFAAYSQQEEEIERLKQ